MIKRDAAALVGALAGCTIFVLGKFHNQFVFDDVYVVGGALIHEPRRIFEVFAAHALIAHGESATTPMDTYRPLSLVTFFWDAWLSGHEPWSYHLTNHLVHLSVVAGLFALARRLLPQASSATLAVVALFFGLSPQLAEGHVWINGRSDPLATLFGLLALLVWRGEGSARPAPGRQLGTGVLFFAGLLCKESLLFALPSLALWPAPPGQRALERLRRLLPFAIAAGCYLALRSWALQGLHAAAGEQQLLGALRNVPVLWADGLSQLLAPSRLYLRSMRDEYGLLSAGQRAAVAALALACAALAFAARRRLPVLAWGLSWFACTLAPAAMISVLLWPGFGRFLYLPCVGLALGAGELLSRAGAALAGRFEGDPRRGRLARGLGGFAIAIYLLALGAQLATVTENYTDDKRLYLTAARAAPRPAYAYGSYGAARALAGDPRGAIAPLAMAVKLDPGDPAYLQGLANAYLRAGDPFGAAALLRSAIQRAPVQQAGDLRLLLVQALAAVDPGAAVTELCQCLHYQPTHAECLRAPSLLLDPRGPRAADFRDQFANLEAHCNSARARGALAGVLGAR
jgi:tetratricopeptide (TPR) repeat protein